MESVMQVQGEVAAVTDKYGGGFKIGEQWYSCYAGQQPPAKGSTVVGTAVQEGKNVYIDLNNAQVSAPAPKPAGGNRGGSRGGGGWGKPKEPRDIYGPIFGHNLLVAATVLGPGQTDVGQLINLAKQITVASEQAVEALVASKTGQQQAAAPAAPVAPAPAPQPAQQGVPQVPGPPAVPPPPAQPAAPAAGTFEFDDDVPW